MPETSPTSSRGTAVDEATDEQTRPAPGAARPGLRRVLDDLLRPSAAQAMIAVILCLVSMASVWQMRANREDQTYSSLRRDELIALLGQLDRSNDDLRTQVAAQEEQKRQLESGVADQQEAQQQAARRIQELAILNGTAPAQGPGVVIVIRDPDAKVTAQLLLDGLEEMRDAGAEVMELNGVRIVASSWLGGTPGRITVSGQPIRAPYELRVIGEPHALAQGARFRGGLVSRVEAPEVGGSISVTEKDTLTITSLHTPSEPKFSRPA